MKTPMQPKLMDKVCVLDKDRSHKDMYDDFEGANVIILEDTDGCPMCNCLWTIAEKNGKKIISRQTKLKV